MILRALEPNDIELLYQIENDSREWVLSATNMPYSREFLANYILSTTGDIYIDKQVRLVISDENDAPVGLVDLQNFDPKNLRAEVGIAILPDHRGRGLAVRALTELLCYAASTLHLHQVYAIIPVNNAASIAMVRKCGFLHQNTLKDWVFDGNIYQDALFFQRIL